MRTRICLYILLLVPLAVYWQTAFYDYGMTTDYANLRAGHRFSEHAGASGRLAIVSRATWPDEEVRFGTVGEIHKEGTGLSSPAILILGNVIAFRKGDVKS